MSEFLSVSEVADFLGVRPRAISDLFYRRDLAGEGCPIVGGRRLIPASKVNLIRTALRRRGIRVLDDSNKGDM